jgi:prepilin-type N-terminal cleavage/methylation domain-containing protein
MTKKIRTQKRGDSGFSLIELMFAVGVLAVAIVGSMAMVVIGIGRNGSNRMDTTATNVAQTVLEGLATMPLPPPAAPAAPTITDCAGNVLQLTTAPGGASLTSNGDIDFQTPAPPGYYGNYTMCGTNGLKVVYDVRWRVDVVNASSFARLVTVAARQPFAVQKGTMVYIPPVTLRTIVGQ